MQKERRCHPYRGEGATKQYLNTHDKLLCRVQEKHWSTIIWLDALINGLASWEILWAEYWSAQGKPGACSALEMREGRESKRERERVIQEMRNALLFNLDTCAHELEFNEGYKTQILGRQKEIKARSLNHCEMLGTKNWYNNFSIITASPWLWSYLVWRWSPYNCKDYHNVPVCFDTYCYVIEPI